ncbi:MAG TPA: TspO/MBR family protein [archaeon]|nr:TspO/MBR family protein [archaeon]
MYNYGEGKFSIEKIIIMIVIAELAGIIGSIFTTPAIGSWYASLNKPWFTPPSWVFGPVWLTLYALMGIAAGIVWHSKSKIKERALQIYGFQLFLNLVWSLLFFGLRNPLYGLIDIVLMWIAIAATIFMFYKVNKKSAALLIPYIIWVTIATALNYYVLVLN